MKRAEPYKIFIVLAIIVAGIICMLLPEKKEAPTASVKRAVEINNINNADTIDTAKI